MRYLAIDQGHKRIGLALCDAEETMASPLKIIENGPLLFQQIREVVQEYGIEAFVVGLPYNMDGTEGPRAVEVRRFAEKLMQTIPLPLDFFDERLSSFQAEEKLTGLDLTRKGKKKRMDAVAAAAIFQNFLDSKKQNE